MNTRKQYQRNDYYARGAVFAALFFILSIKPVFGDAAAEGLSSTVREDKGDLCSRHLPQLKVSLRHPLPEEGMIAHHSPDKKHAFFVIERGMKQNKPYEEREAVVHVIVSRGRDFVVTLRQVKTYSVKWIDSGLLYISKWPGRAFETVQVIDVRTPAVVFSRCRSYTQPSYLKQAADGKHLFFLSGQSNMVGLDPAETFVPEVADAFGKDSVIVVKDAKGGQPIRYWCMQWNSADGKRVQTTGDLYDRLLEKVAAAVQGEKIKTATFVWMQGERDAFEKHGDVYAETLAGLLAQLKRDLGCKRVNFVIGRISDFDMENKRYKHWTIVRKAQVKVAEADPHGAWVDTDDLNDGKNRNGKMVANDLHYSVEGYRKLGRRFAEKAIELIKQQAQAD